MKRIIRLTESELYGIIKSSVNHVLNEGFMKNVKDVFKKRDKEEFSDFDFDGLKKSLLKRLSEYAEAKNRRSSKDYVYINKNNSTCTAWVYVSDDARLTDEQLGSVETMIENAGLDVIDTEHDNTKKATSYTCTIYK